CCPGIRCSPETNWLANTMYRIYEVFYTRLFFMNHSAKTIPYRKLLQRGAYKSHPFQLRCRIVNTCSAIKKEDRIKLFKTCRCRHVTTDNQSYSIRIFGKIKMLTDR